MNYENRKSGTAPTLRKIQWTHRKKKDQERSCALLKCKVQLNHSNFLDKKEEEKKEEQEDPTRLTSEEIKNIKENLLIPGVRMYCMNPKALHIDNFIGKYDQEVVEWTEGILSKTVKDCTNEQSSIM